MFSDALVYWSARAAGVALFAAAMLAIHDPRGGRSRRSLRAAWTCGCALLVAHEALALGLSFGWSQTLAWRSIAEQTRAVIGVDFGGGLIVNYLAAAVWAADVLWWWLRPASRARRALWIDVAAWAFLAAMFFFGAVVFATGWTRVVAAALFAVVLVSAAAGWIGVRFSARR